MKLAGAVIFYRPDDREIRAHERYLAALDRLYFVDNSGDGRMRLSDGGKITYLDPGENLGIAAALNMAAQKAIEEGYQWLLTLDQDCQITADVVTAMKRYLETTDTAGIGLISPYQDIGSQDADDRQGETQDMLTMMTSGNIINLQAYQQIGGFRDELFIDCVDIDYCMNLHCHGYRVIRLNQLSIPHSLGDRQVHHLLGKTIVYYQHSPLREYYIVRNNLYLEDWYGDRFPDYFRKQVRVRRGQLWRILLFADQKGRRLAMMRRGAVDHRRGITGKYRP